MDEQEARRRFTAARVAILATVDDRGAPHLVPVTFAVEAPAPPAPPTPPAPPAPLAAPTPPTLTASTATPGAPTAHGASGASASPGPPASPAGAAPVVVWSATDAKPKRGGPLRRHANIRAHPAVSLLVQHWDERWDELWWVRADGAARVVDDPAAVQQVTRLLREKYRQYERVAVAGPLIRVEVRAWQGWAASSR